MTVTVYICDRRILKKKPTKKQKKRKHEWPSLKWYGPKKNKKKQIFFITNEKEKMIKNDKTKGSLMIHPFTEGEVGGCARRPLHSTATATATFTTSAASATSATSAT
jgi:hypothetical protein